MTESPPPVRATPLALVLALPLLVIAAFLAVFLVLGVALPLRFDLARALGKRFSEGGALVACLALAALAGGTLLLAGRAGARARLAVALATARSFVRHPLFWILAPGLLVLVVLKVASIDSHGGAFANARLGLKNAVSWASTLAALLAVLLPALSLSDEFISRSAYVNLSKPVGRGAFLTGKLLGCLAVIGLFLAAFLLTADAFVRIRLARAPAASETGEGADAGRAADVGAGQAAGHGRLVFRTLVEAGTKPGADRTRPAGARRPAAVLLRRGGRYRAEFTLPGAALREDEIVVRLLAYPASMERFFRADLIAVTEGARPYEARGLSCRLGRTVEATIPRACAADDGRLVLELVNAGGARVRLRTDGAMWIAAPADALETGLAKAWIALMAKAALLACLSLACATVLSFQVSALVGLFVLVAGGLMGYAKSWIARVVESAAAGGAAAGGEEAAIGFVAVWLRGLARVLPDFAASDPAPFVGDLERLPWIFLLAAVLGLLAVRAVPCMLAGTLAFRRREADR